MLESLTMAILTQSTCGEACWEAREDICRCSCNGKNHGIARTGERPARMCKIDGYFYRMGAVGDIRAEAERINKTAGIKSQEKMADGYVYHYYWHETDKGAPARVKAPSTNQKKWKEVQPFVDDCKPWELVYILWIRDDTLDPRRAGYV